MIVLAWIASLVIVAILAYISREIVERLKAVETYIKTKVEKKSEPKDNTSTFIDPDDIAGRTKYEHEQMLKKLND